MVEMARTVGDWIAGRARRRAALVVRGERRGPIGGGNSPNAAATEPDVLPPGDQSGLQDAIDAYATPSHAEFRSIRFREVTAEGELDTKDEEWRRRGNGMVFTGVDTRVVAASGVAANADQLTCRCSKCRKFDVFSHVCARCGRAFCAQCSVRAVTPEAELTLCRDCWRMECREFDTWEAVDQALARGKRPVPEPLRPFAANSEPHNTRRPKS
jgi:hypothetical protein